MAEEWQSGRGYLSNGCVSPPKGLRGRSRCFACVISDGECFVSLFKNWILSLLCSFLSACCHGEVGWGWKLCPSLCQHFWTCQLPPAPSPDGGCTGPHWVGRPFLCQHRSCSSILLGTGVSFVHALTRQLDIECLDVLGSVLCSVSTEVTVAGDAPITRQDPASSQKTLSTGETVAGRESWLGSGDPGLCPGCDPSVLHGPMKPLSLPKTSVSLSEKFANWIG